MALCAVMACGGSSKGGDDAEAGSSGGPEPAAVVVARTERGDIAAVLSVASTIEAERAITVHTESTGRIRKLTVEEGDPLRTGQRIARIEGDAQALGIDRAAASLAKAERELKAVKGLHARRIASQDELETVRLNLQNAKLDLQDRRRDLKNTRVTAPIAGTITERFVSEGEFVQRGAQVVSIVDLSTLVARIYVPERELDRIALGQTAKIVGKAARGRNGVGTIARIAPVVDAMTGTIKVTVSLPPDSAKVEHGFLPGMYAEVTLETDRRINVLLVEKQALVRVDDDVSVFVVDDGKAKRRSVQLGLEDAAMAEIVAGLDEGDAVVVAGQAGLSDDDPVTIVDPAGDSLVTSAAADGVADLGSASVEEGS